MRPFFNYVFHRMQKLNRRNSVLSYGALVVLWVALLHPQCAFGQDREGRSKSRLWSQIAPYFEVPGKYKCDSGRYVSPLFFENGKKVTTKAQWMERRKEILSYWNGMMGKWPPLLKDQQFRILGSEKRGDITQYTIRFKWTPNEFTNGYLLVPKGKGKRPAVITVYYEPETLIGKNEQAPNRDFALQLAGRGFITLALGTSESSKNNTFSIFYPSINNATVQPLSMLAYAAANAWYALSNFPGVDKNRIGILGHSFGGKWAMFASCLFDKFSCAAWSDPGIVFGNTPDINYWEPWYLGYYPPPWRKRGLITADNPAKGIYNELLESRHDLLELHALMAPRPFLVSGGSADTAERWNVLKYSIAVNKLLGYKNRVAMTNRQGHAPTPRSNQQIGDFFEYFLK